MFEKRYELALDNTLKGYEMLKLYCETGNELYKILGSYYLDTEDLVEHSKLLKVEKQNTGD